MNDIDPKQYNVACKYFMNGYCKNGIECSYYHPQPNEFMIYYNILLREQLISNPPMIPYCQVMPQPPAYFVNQQQLTSPNSYHHNTNTHHHHHQQKYVPPNISMYSEVFEDGDEEVSFYQPKVCTFYLSGKVCTFYLKFLIV
ncbi:predicted protein [Naegleria gruberi]|uniref:Predicted protein n=1 Tax=Naegleria gruberi TaxID=5762 RepID=D2V953_NAEGR|nr:uncharacterized protein NAEGRDRAFT_65568 [Naegleria gruberi]EFC46652.1 predicted protein [Naegleria gruberi]|eukprot:XP_002679396.1 predicted protein [Naegleria gruberi strain NEG-M]